MTRDEILGEVQALRAEILHVRNRAHGRDLKRKILELHRIAIAQTRVDGSGEEEGAGAIVDGFVREAQETITALLGTSAWDEPETVEEAKARMAPLPAAPGSEPPPAWPGRDGKLLKASDINCYLADYHAWLARTCADVLPPAERKLARLRSEEWLERAATEIHDGLGDDPAQNPTEREMVEILRKHRDDKA